MGSAHVFSRESRDNCMPRIAAVTAYNALSHLAVADRVCTFTASPPTFRRLVAFAKLLPGATFLRLRRILYMQRAREPRGRRPWAREPRGRRPILPARAERRHPVRARGDPPRVRRQHHLHARALQVLQQEHSTGRTTPSFSTCSRRTTATHALISLSRNSPNMPATDVRRRPSHREARGAAARCGSG